MWVLSIVEYFCLSLSLLYLFQLIISGGQLLRPLVLLSYFQHTLCNKAFYCPKLRWRCHIFGKNLIKMLIWLPDPDQFYVNLIVAARSSELLRARLRTCYFHHIIVDRILFFWNDIEIHRSWQSFCLLLTWSTST